MDNEKIEKLQQMIDESSNIVFFGGAGVSTESNIPDFRSTDGLYHQTYKYPPEVMVSHTFYTQHTEEFYDFYKKYFLDCGAKPNNAHYALSKLENMGKSSSSSGVGTGGMSAKVEAAKIATASGADMVITNGNNVENIISIITGKETGTLFLGHKSDNFDLMEWL